MNQDPPPEPEQWPSCHCVTRKGELLLTWDRRNEPGEMQNRADTMTSARDRFAPSEEREDGKAEEE